MSAMNPQLRHAGDTDDVLAQSRMHALEHGHSFFQDLIATDASIPSAIARLTLGLVMLPHALQKAFGWFGGAGFSGTYHVFTTGLGLPGMIALLAICAEIFGSLSLILGFLTRVGALAIMAVMLGAIVVVNAPNGFFMNWMGQKAGEGSEYHLLALGLGLVCLLVGGGRTSIDRAMMKWRPAEGGGISPVLTQEP